MKHIYIALIGTAFLLGSCDEFPQYDARITVLKLTRKQK